MKIYRCICHPEKPDPKVDRRPVRLIVSGLGLALRDRWPTIDLASVADAVTVIEGQDISKEPFVPSCPRCGSQDVQHLQERRRGSSA